MDDEDIDIVEFLSVEDSEDEDEEITQINKPKTNIVNELMNKVAKHQVNENMSYKGAAKMANMMNEMSNAAVEIRLKRNSIKETRIQTIRT